ncbi:efflux RND transporter periplasmic adaptor subunit [Roseiarcus sp.]|uniref:efflux RND transporter periplasmic adaptor subunit n=1 Tax=Roseiarcus sp. TaxID=1969460 RepID=UPI003F9B8618
MGVVATAFIGGGIGWRVMTLGAEPPRPDAPPPPVPVVATKVQVSDVPIVITGIGTVEPYNVVDVHTQVTGTLEKIGFVEGQVVKPGDLIAQIDPRPYQAALQEDEAILKVDEAHLANAEVNLRRYQTLFKQDSIATMQVDDEDAKVSQLRATIIQENATIFNARTQLGYTTITAPIAGVTGIRKVDVGNIVQPTGAGGDTTPIVTITEIQPISVVFTLPQKDLQTVRKAMKDGALTTVAYSQDDTMKLDEGSLLLVDNTVLQSSGTVQLKATFPNKNDNLWPGQFVNVRLNVAVRHDAITVPITALQQGQDGQFVFVVRPDGKVEERPVVDEQTLDARALISSGLEPGDTVVVAGQYRLCDGVQVVQVPANDPRVQNTTEASAGML